jgi:hypothetical protein
MLLQTNSYIVPRDKRVEHARLLRRFRQTLLRLGCDHFEVYEQVGANWNTGETTGRFVQIMRFRDRKHQLSVQAAERGDPIAQQVVQEFCELINFPYQQQQGLFAVGFYTSFLRMPPQRTTSPTEAHTAPVDSSPEQEATSFPAGMLSAVVDRGPDEHAPDPIPAPHPGVVQHVVDHPDEVDMNSDDVLGADADQSDDPEALLTTDKHGLEDSQDSDPNDLADSQQA